MEDFRSWLTRRQIIRKGKDLFMSMAIVSVFPFRLVASSWNEKSKEGGMKLPDPRNDGTISVEKAIKDRRTVRWFSGREISAEQLSQILWAAQGITDDSGFKRAAPSAGALYPMDLYTVVGTGCVEGFNQGLYHYEPGSHVLSLALGGDHRDELARASLSQTWMAKAPVNIVICAEYERISPKYGSRGERYAMIEAGHIAQNIFLQAQALGLGAGIVGAFNDDDVIRVMRINPTHRPLLIMPIGFR